MPYLFMIHLVCNVMVYEKRFNDNYWVNLFNTLKKERKKKDFSTKVIL